MQVKITRPIMLGGKTYRPGVHDVDAGGWFFDALVADGAIVPAETPQEPAKEPQATTPAPEAEKPRKRAKKGS